MFERIISLALIIIPFVSIQNQDIKELKSALAFAVMLALGLLSAYHFTFKKFTNKYVLLFIFYMWLSIMLAPLSGVKLYGMELGAFWAWKPFTYILAYFFGIWAIASYEFTNLKRILKVAMYVGLAMAVFTLIQVFCLDQFFKTITSAGTYHERGALGGTLGHPNFVSCFIAMIIPLAIFLKKKWIAVIMVITVLVIRSQMAIGSMVLSLIFLLWTKNRKLAYKSLIASTLLVTSLLIWSPGTIRSSNRVPEWKRITQDVINPENPMLKYPITGKGLGSFYYTYHVIHTNDKETCGMYQAHNEYLEILYNCGLIGLALFLLAILDMVKKNWMKSHYRNCLLASFFCVALNAGGIFAWQLGASMLFTALIVGLLHNKVECV